VAEDPRHAGWRAEFKKLGESGVRMIDSGSQAVPDDKTRFSRVWLKEREDARRDAKEADTLSIARRALRSSYWANAIATIAAIIAVIAIIFGK
jgi:hypothetical protein